MNISDAEITLCLFSNLHARLPPDPDGLNENRADYAESLLNSYINTTGTDRKDAVSDLLNNIIHWCDRNGVVFNDELTRARDHYIFDTDGDAVARTI